MSKLSTTEKPVCSLMQSDHRTRGLAKKYVQKTLVSCFDSERELLA